MPDRRLLDTEPDPDPDPTGVFTPPIKPIHEIRSDETEHADYIIWRSTGGHQLEHKVMHSCWREHLASALEHKVCAIIDTLAEKLELDKFELSICWTDDPHVHRLNAQYRGQDKPTNILSFPDQDGSYIGDLMLGFETIQKEAQSLDLSLQHHLTHLLVHGILHLLGYDHIEDKEAEEMEKLEIALLSSVGIENPYVNPDQGDSVI